MTGKAQGVVMIKELMHDPIFLAGKSEATTKDDLQVAQDLLDTLMAHRDSCVGMAANMISRLITKFHFLSDSNSELLVNSCSM